MLNKKLKIAVHDGENIQNAIDKLYSLLENDASYTHAQIDLDGTFYIDRPIEFRRGCVFPITLNGQRKTVIDGGWHISGFRETNINGVSAWCVEADRELADYLCINQLFVNGQRRERTTYPENEFIKMTGVVFDGHKKMKVDLNEKEKYWCMSNSIFSYEGELPSLSRVEDIVLMINHCWLHEQLRIKKIDYEQKLIYTDNASLFAAFPDERVYLENVFEKLSKSGQWYLDKSNYMLYYIPMEGEQINKTDVVIPIADSFIVADDTANKHITGITFRYCSSSNKYRTALPFRSPWHKIETSRQAECEIAGSIRFTKSQHCSISECLIENIGGYGIEIAEQSNYICICHNEFQDLGCGAIKNYRRDADAIRVPEDETHHVRIEDNTICNYGRVYKAAVGILMTDVHHYIVSHNKISKGEYTAISCGWTWGYESTICGNNEISYNYISHIGNKNVCDMGAIYMLGVQPGTFIKNNIIHDVVDREENGWGIYLDEGSSEITIENNIVYRVSTEPMHIHYGRNNRIINNIFACGCVALLSNTRYENHTQMIVEGNIFYSENGKMFRIMRGENSIWSDKNIFYSKTGSLGYCRNNYEKNMEYISFDEWKQTGNDRYSIDADPLFIDANNDNYELEENSPAFDLGFKKIDITNVGVRKIEME